VNGATVFDLFKQFVTEAIVTNLIAVAAALTILQLVRQPLASVLEIFVVDLWSTKPEVWIALGVTLLCGVMITGFYPAYVCIRRQPRTLFSMKSASSKSFVKSLLTTIQFAVAIVLISWVFVVYLQLNYILKKDVGLNQDGVILIDGPVVKPPDFAQKFETFVKEMNNLPAIAGATSSRYMIGDATDKPGNVRIVGSDTDTGADGNGVNEDFIPFFGLKMLAGRNFVANDRADAVILSWITAQRLGFKNPTDAIGTKVQLNTGNWNVRKFGDVVGVVEDYRLVPFFNYSGTNTIMSEGGFGLFLTYRNALFPELTPENLAIRVDLSRVDEVLPVVQRLYQSFFPANTFEWRFLNEQITRVYGNEKVARNQILMFTCLAIGIACLGLVAMMTQRIFDMTREVGIRKVLGASIFELTRTLVQNTSAQFLIAAALGIPLSVYLGVQYLQYYSERIALSWWHYGMPIGILLALMSCAVAHMLWKALRANPVDSLKHE
jgi:putative ABC transport system permease protein